MDAIERELWERDVRAIAGIDEAGRGPLAGPVVAAAVVFERGCNVPAGINDSKKLSPLVREKLYDLICMSARAVGLGIVDQTEIDSINILQATFKAMKQAVLSLPIIPDHVLVDGNRAPGFESPCTTIIKGDSRSFTIAAASIIAKVSRDRIMAHIDDEYPLYGFKTNKGYATKSHIHAIREYGLSPQHRVTFCKKIINPQLKIWK